jgi:PKD repeat protein
MFTIGQVNRMLSILNSTIANRNNLWSPANLLFTGTDSVTYFNPPLCKPIADFKVDKKIVCPNQSVQFTDLSYNEQPTQWTWFFEGGNPSYSNDQNPTVTYLHGGNYRVKLIVSNLAGSDSLIRDHYILVLNDSVIHQNYYYENFEHFNPELSFFTFDKESQTQWQVDSINANSSCLMLRNYLLQQSEKTFFITPAINISSIPSPILSFRVAFKQISNSTENNLRVFANQNCNSTWFLRYNKNGTYLQTVTDTNTSEFFPQSDADWRYENVVINNVASGSQVRFKFEYNNESGNNIFIDDINVYSLVTGEKFPLLSLTDEIYLYPNPTQQTNSVSIKNLQSGNLAIYIYDISGRLIFQKNETINTHNYTLNSLNEIVNNKGLYIFRIINNQHVCNKPLIIN